MSERGYVITVKGYCAREVMALDAAITVTYFNTVLWPRFEDWLHNEAESKRLEYGKTYLHEEMWELFKRFQKERKEK